MNRLRRYAFAVWLALALVVGQQAAALHALGHAAERFASQKDSAPAQHSSAECFLCAALSGAAAAPPLALHLLHATSATPAPRDHRGIPIAARFAYLSRAPPALL